ALLTGGKTGRLYRKLVEGEEVASEVSASNQAGRYPGWFSIQVQLLKGKDRDQVEKLVLQELKRLRDEPVSAAELKRVQQTILTHAAFARDRPRALPDTIPRGVTPNAPAFLRNYLPKTMAVTADDVQKAARTYLDPEQRVVVWSIPKPGGGEGSGKDKRPGPP